MGNSSIHFTKDDIIEDVLLNPESSISTWWNPTNMKKVQENAPDRLNVKDTRMNPKQRPDVLVDTEFYQEM